eukprot:CAMPEP_0203858504 /NCGR_PEP_ID=MMETSP0359-20131031/11315_1 /ASSEMBLY_ACC=CAM_ASM_000338 /TAXON_ID=268821 /ORGANISM="Scrippsiella Hangoei, Strain SHTV-5" /LENGTH=133 /DNA_ID=CAMNT_0050775291 /DNA_START=8 /DNA_END=410 /DNA_ORIENTATION=-
MSQAHMHLASCHVQASGDCADACCNANRDGAAMEIHASGERAERQPAIVPNDRCNAGQDEAETTIRLHNHVTSTHASGFMPPACKWRLCRLSAAMRVRMRQHGKHTQAATATNGRQRLYQLNAAMLVIMRPQW